ncbi:MAG: hypothetical protein ACLP9D_13445 [Candidatus Bathyarchaeia archaeon]
MVEIKDHYRILDPDRPTKRFLMLMSSLWLMHLIVENQVYSTRRNLHWLSLRVVVMGVLDGVMRRGWFDHEVG